MRARTETSSKQEKCKTVERGEEVDSEPGRKT